LLSPHRPILIAEKQNKLGRDLDLGEVELAGVGVTGQALDLLLVLDACLEVGTEDYQDRGSFFADASAYAKATADRPADGSIGHRALECFRRYDTISFGARGKRRPMAW